MYDYEWLITYEMSKSVNKHVDIIIINNVKETHSQVHS